ncbi:MAG TPA: amidohydrolase family protein [Ktedonobacteraceae bacterium]|nr:amidohydrolase family protein [Ktedonobacteraceae bacterium]
MQTNRITAITNARIFDGERVIDAQTVVISGASISTIGGAVPSGAAVVNAGGATLIPGLIDAHVHTSLDGLRDALAFGVTTELEMQGHWTAQERQEVAERDDLADIRSAGMGITAPGGHPSELFPKGEDPGDNAAHAPADDGHAHGFVAPFASTPQEATDFVDQLVANGSDYIKIMIEEGSVLGSPGLPMLDNETIVAAVRAAHRHHKLAIAHTLTFATTAQAIAAGMDGLAHLFLDRPHTPELIAAIAEVGAFVTPCLVLNSSILGNASTDFAADERVSSKLSPEWLITLRSCFNTFPQGNFADVLATVAALHRAGVDILAGTDVSVPVPSFGGLAHGASVHHELQLLVAAGLSPIEALRAATSTPARRFGLSDRGRIVPGARADLLLVEGDPITNISDTLSIALSGGAGPHSTCRGRSSKPGKMLTKKEEKYND